MRILPKNYRVTIPAHVPVTQLYCHEELLNVKDVSDYADEIVFPADVEDIYRAHKNTSAMHKFITIQNNSCILTLKNNLSITQFISLMNAEQLCVLFKFDHYLFHEWTEEIPREQLSYRASTAIDSPSDREIELLRNLQKQLKLHQTYEIGFMNRVEQESSHTLWCINDKIRKVMYKTEPLFVKRTFSPQKYMFKNSYDDLDKINVTFECSGGVLASKQGTGKTITCLGLIYVTATQNAPIQSRLLGDKINTNATLVVVPPNVYFQWAGEIQSLYPESFLKRVLFVREKRHLSLINPETLRNAALVLTTYSFLESDHSKIIDPDHPQRNLFAYHWKRVVFDEYRNTNLNSKQIQRITSLKASFRWAVSGTPGSVSDYRTFNDILAFIKPEMSFTEYNENSRYLFSKILLDYHIRRNEYSFVEDISFEIEYVDLLQEEKIIYESAKIANRSKEELVKLSSFFALFHKETGTSSEEDKFELNVLNPRTAITEIQRVREKELEILRSDVHTTQETLRETQMVLERLMNGRGDANEIRSCRMTISACKNKLRILDMKIQSNSQSIHFIKEQLSILEAIVIRKNTDEQDDSTKNCSICLSEFVDPVMTECGHLFCLGCIVSSLNQSRNCPMCRLYVDKPVFLNDAETNSGSSVCQPVVGSKLLAIVNAVKNCSEKILIFCQWERLIHEVEKALHENSISSLRLKGNTHTIASSIRKFRDNPDIRVMILSSEYAAAGTNLTMASRVFFVHPYVEDDSNTVSYNEQQAIGRVFRQGQTKPVVVTHFVSRGTIEEELVQNRQHF
jgi:SNF2 family DNA or RNA helicase